MEISVKKVSDTEVDLIFSGNPEKDWHFYTQKDEMNPFTFTYENQKITSWLESV